MSKKSLDVNLIMAFDHLWRLRSVSMAAAAMGVSQPAISGYLSKLRNHFNDQLFLWNGKSMVPTEMAESISVVIRNILDGLERLDFHSEALEVSSRRRVTIAAADYILPMVSSFLLKEAETAAPRLQMDFIPTSYELHSPKGRGGVNMIIIPDGAIEDLGYMRKIAYRDKYVIVGRRDFFEDKEIGIHSLEEYEMILFSLTPGLIHNHFMRGGVLKGMNIKYRCTYPSFLSIFSTMLNINQPLLTVAPRMAVKSFDPLGKFVTFDADGCFPNYDMGLFWNPSENEDLVCKWIRDSIFNLLQNKSHS